MGRQGHIGSFICLINPLRLVLFSDFVDFQIRTLIALIICILWFCFRLCFLWAYRCIVTLAPVYLNLLGCIPSPSVRKMLHESHILPIALLAYHRPGHLHCLGLFLRWMGIIWACQRYLARSNQSRRHTTNLAGSHLVRVPDYFVKSLSSHERMLQQQRQQRKCKVLFHVFHEHWGLTLAGTCTGG
jgi:hypothetical protein